MTLGETLVAVWQQVMVEGKRSVELGEATYRVRKTGGKSFRRVEFDYEAHRLSGIEQNPGTGSRWADLARQGQRVMQFSYQGRYLGNVCEGKLLRYPAWQALGLPE
jgi:hypothetical protein